MASLVFPSLLLLVACGGAWPHSSTSFITSTKALVRPWCQTLLLRAVFCTAAMQQKTHDLCWSVALFCVGSCHQQRNLSCMADQNHLTASPHNVVVGVAVMFHTVIAGRSRVLSAVDKSAVINLRKLAGQDFGCVGGGGNQSMLCLQMGTPLLAFLAAFWAGFCTKVHCRSCPLQGKKMPFVKDIATALVSSCKHLCMQSTGK